MNDFQQTKITEMNAIGWTEKGSEFLSGTNRNNSSYIFKMESESGRVAYIYPTFVHFN